MDNLVTKRLAKLQVEALLSEGSLGPIYLARDLTLDRQIALLVVPRPIARRPGFSERFLAAAQRAAALSHPSIAAIYDIAEHDGEFFLSTEYVPGLSLDSYLGRLSARRQTIQVDEAIFLIKQVADALVQAHALGAAHGDIRPESLYINRLPYPDRPGEPPLRVKIVGFGLVSLQQEAVSGLHLASMPFPSAVAEDVQALALIFCRMVMGVRSLQDNNGEPSSLSQLNADPRVRHGEVELLPAIADIVNRARAVLPEVRFASAEEFRDSLSRAADAIADSLPRRSGPMVGGVSLTAPRVALNAPAGPTLEALPAGTGPLLIISHPDQRPESRRLDQLNLSVGRSEENDITLPSGGVSRRHIRLVYESEHWLVTDLASTNGTLLEGDLLEPCLPCVWRSGEMLQVGPYTLRWLPELVELRSGSFESDPAQMIRLSIEPDDVRIQPGEQARFVVSLLSRLATAGRFQLTVFGLPETWLTSSAEFVTLEPGIETLATLTITPPRTSAATSGRWPFGVRIAAENDRAGQLSVPAQVTLLVFVHYTAKLEPKVVRTGKACRLLLRNNGNTTTTFNIHGASTDNSLNLVAAPKIVRLSPGEDGEADLTLFVQRRPYWGTPRLSRFQVVIHSPGARPSILSGQIMLRPLFSWRRLLYAAAAVLLITLLAFVLLIPLR